MLFRRTFSAFKILIFLSGTVFVLLKQLFVTRNKRTFQSKLQNSAADDELSFLIKHLSSQNSFIIDIDYLKYLNNNKNENLDTYKFNIDYFKKFIKYNGKIHVSFGIKSEFVGRLSLKIVNKLFGLNCTIDKHKSSFLNKTVLIAAFIRCQNVDVQISVFHERGDFLWIDNALTVESKWFGDTPRAVQNFEVDIITDKYSGILLIPKDIKRFLYDYNHSTFLECNKSLVQYNSNLFDYNNKNNSIRDGKIMQSLRYLINRLELMEKNYWLTSGTLLGWYRDCGIIPHTTDIDVAMNIEDYDDRIKNTFFGNNILYTYLTISTLDNGFEMRLFDNVFNYDLFFLYHLNETHRWSGYYVDNCAYQTVYNNVESLCSAELESIKVLVPCNPVRAIQNEYGYDWAEPKADGYKFVNIDEKSCKKLTKLEWLNLFKEYDLFGNLIENNKVF